MSRNTIFVAIIWLALAALIFYLVDNIQNPNKIDRLGENSTVVLKRGLDGHYRAEALINGEKVNVLVDTGATGVATAVSAGLTRINAPGVRRSWPSVTTTSSAARPWPIAAIPR